MTLTFVSPEWALKIREEWKKNNAPCYLKKTSSPVDYSVCVRKGVDPVLVNLFIVENCMAPGFPNTILPKNRTNRERTVNEQ